MLTPNIIDFTPRETIQINYLVEGLTPIEQVEGSDWIDLRAAEDVFLQKGNFHLISLGVAMKLPEGYEAHVIPRSSTFKKYGIIQSNSVGLIDQSYHGNSDCWKYPVIAMRDTYINKNDRICQFRIVENQPKITFQTVNSLDGTDRGGFGSTGVQ